MFKWRGPKEFEHETERAKQIVLERPAYWEYSLTEELLSSGLIQVRRSFDDLKKGLSYRKTVRIPNTDCPKWLMSKMEDFLTLLVLVGALMTGELKVAWRSGNAVEIKRVADKLISVCNQLLEWEIELRAVVPPEPFLRIRRMMEGWTFQYFDAIESVPVKLRNIIEQPGESTHTIEYVLEPPNNFEEIKNEIEELAKHLYKLL